jgi:hypothetical protein
MRFEHPRSTRATDRRRLAPIRTMWTARQFSCDGQAKDTAADRP